MQIFFLISAYGYPVKDIGPFTLMEIDKSSRNYSGRIAGIVAAGELMMSLFRIF